MLCCTSGQPCKHGLRDTNSVRPESQPQGSSSNIEWQDLGSETMTRLGGITSPVVGGPLHVKDYPRPPVRTRFWPFHAACSRSIHITRRLETAITYILLLLIHVADLEPDIGMCKWTRRVPQNAVEAHETVVVLTLLLVNDAEPE
jgi:hypothetical protein